MVSDLDSYGVGYGRFSDGINTQWRCAAQAWLGGCDCFAGKGDQRGSRGVRCRDGFEPRLDR